MRLIDADKLLRFFTIDTANQTYRFGTIKKQIENAETVKAIPIPDNATNGDMMKAMFPSLKIRWVSQSHIGVTFRDNQDYITELELDWWNAPYKRGNEE